MGEGVYKLKKRIKMKISGQIKEYANIKCQHLLSRRDKEFSREGDSIIAVLELMRGQICERVVWTYFCIQEIGNFRICDTIIAGIDRLISWVAMFPSSFEIEIT